MATCSDLSDTLDEYEGRIQDLGKGGSIGIRTRAKFSHTHVGIDHADSRPEQRVNRAFFDSVSFKGEPQ